MQSKLINQLIEHVSRVVNKHDGLIPSASIPISEAKYKLYHTATPAERGAFHEELKELARETNSLELAFQVGGFGERDLLKRVEIKDSLVLLSHQGVTILAHQVEEALGKVDTALAVLTPGLAVLKEPIEKSWREGKRYSNCPAEQVDKLCDGLSFFDWCQKNDGKQADIRTISIQLFEDSKRLEGLMSICASLLRPDSPDSVADAPADEVMAYWGVQRFPGSFRMRANLIVSTPKGELDCATGWPWVALPPDAIASIRGGSVPPYVLLIENKTTFERYCREVDDEGWVFYTNGFPSRRWCRLFHCVESLLAEDIPIYHWGDIDIGGFRIFNHLDSYFDRDLIPYCMDHFSPASTDTKGVAVSDLVALLKASENPWVQALHQQLTHDFSHEGAIIAWVEQERLPVTAPFKG